MGLIHSYLNQNKQKKIKELEIINQSIANLKLLYQEEKRQYQNLLILKQDNQNNIKLQESEISRLKHKYSQTIETIKLFECKICMEKMNKVMVVPCGHCFCDVCAKNFKECPICRTQIDAIHNIYFN